MKLSYLSGNIYQAHQRRSVIAVGIAVAAVIVLNIVVAVFLTYPAWSTTRDVGKLAEEKKQEELALQALPIVTQAVDDDIHSLIESVPIDFELSRITEVLWQVVEDSNVLLISASQTDVLGAVSASTNGAEQIDNTRLTPYALQVRLLGDLDALLQFLGKIKETNRLFTVESFELAKSDSTGPAADGSEKLLDTLPNRSPDEVLYSLNVTLQAYSLPKSYEAEFASVVEARASSNE